MITVSMVMEKGGVGKTTTALEFAFGLARNDRRVLMIDIDPQAKLAFGLGLRGKLDGSHPNLYHVLVDELPIAKAVVTAPSSSANGLIDLVPGHRAVESVKAALEAKHEAEPARALSRALAQVESERPGYYDVAIVDCQPSLGLLTIMALLASDYVIVPMLTHQQAYDSYPDTLDVITRAKRGNPNLKLFGVLPTQYRRTAAENGVIKLLQDSPEQLPVEEPVGISIRYTEAYTGGISIYDYDRGASDGYEKLVDRFISSVLAPVAAS